MVVKSKAKPLGLTLIELVIVLALLAILALTGVNYGTAWIANSKISIANSNLNIAYRKAVALAIRNPDGVNENSTSTVASSLVLNNSVIETHSASGSVVWSSTLPNSVNITFNSVCANKVEVNNHGLPLNATCLNYTISSQGGTSVNDKLN